MSLRESAEFACNVLIIFALGIVYVAALTAKTFLRGLIGAAKAIDPTSDRDQGRHSPQR